MPIKKTLAIIPSAGSGRRMGSVKKNYLPLLGRPVLAHTLSGFEGCALVSSVIIAAPEGDIGFINEEIVELYGFRKVIKVVSGGAERQDSVRNAIRAGGDGWDIILVHDGARPLITVDIIERTIKAAAESGAAIAAVPVKDTIKEAEGGIIKRTVPRENLWSVQTPQAFRADMLINAHIKAEEDGFLGTDESSLVERAGGTVRVVMGSYENLKITTAEDIAIAEQILKNRAKGT